MRNSVLEELRVRRFANIGLHTGGNLLPSGLEVGDTLWVKVKDGTRKLSIICVRVGKCRKR